MKRLLFTMFLVVASVMAVFAFSFEEANQAQCGPGDQVSVLLSNKQSVQVQQVTALELSETALLSNKTDKSTKNTEVRRTFAPTVLSIDEAPDIYELLLAGVKEKPKENIYNGFGHDHYARADV